MEDGRTYKIFRVEVPCDYQQWTRTTKNIGVSNLVYQDDYFYTVEEWGSKYHCLHEYKFQSFEEAKAFTSNKKEGKNDK